MNARQTYEPQRGETVHDGKTRREGVVMDIHAGHVYLRPPRGGMEWAVNPEHILPTERALAGGSEAA